MSNVGGFCLSSHRHGSTSAVAMVRVDERLGAVRLRIVRGSAGVVPYDPHEVLVRAAAVLHERAAPFGLVHDLIELADVDDRARAPGQSLQPEDHRAADGLSDRCRDDVFRCPRDEADDGGEDHRQQPAEERVRDGVPATTDDAADQLVALFQQLPVRERHVVHTDLIISVLTEDHCVPHFSLRRGQRRWALRGFA